MSLSEVRNMNSLRNAAKLGILSDLVDFDKEPGSNFNYIYKTGKTLFHYACINSQLEIIQYLLGLRHREIDYNIEDCHGNTPFHYICEGQEYVLEAIIDDERININSRDNFGETPFYEACCQGRMGVVKLIIASGRYFHFGKQGFLGYTPYDGARLNGKMQIADLLSEFKKDPGGTRQKLRMELGYDTEKDSGELFALVVYLSDDYFKLASEEK